VRPAHAADTSIMRGQQDLAGEHPLPMRAADAERDQVAGELRERFAERRSSQDSFVRRMDAALRAREQRELAGLLAGCCMIWGQLTAPGSTAGW
jgi:hypothetical protein